MQSKTINSILTVVFLTSCVPDKAPLNLKPAVYSISQTIAKKNPTHKKYQQIDLPDFDKLIVENGLNLKIAKSHKNKLTSKSVKLVFLDNSEEKTLKISSTKLDGNLNLVNLRLKKIPSKVILNGNSKLYIKAGKHSNPFEIKATAKGQIRVAGWPKITKINNQGGANIYAYWLQGPQLDLFSNGGQVYLAGRCNHLIAQLDGNAKLDAYSMKTKHIWLNSSGIAMAKLMPLVSLNAVASDKSQISYFKQLHKNKLATNVYNQANIVFVNRFRPENMQATAFLPKSTVLQK